MSFPAPAFLPALVILLLGCAGCAQETSAFPLDIKTLGQLTPESTASITYEEKGGELLVMVVDKYGDGHIHRLVLGDVTREQALELLQRKQIELERHK